MMVQNPDVVIVGAGAAGIGAGLALTRLGISHVILEAKQRVGGRAYSETSSLGHLWDHGAHWLHSADVNVLRFMAEKLKPSDSGPKIQRSAVSGSFIGGQWKISEFATDYVWTKLRRNCRSRPGATAAMWRRRDFWTRAMPWYPLLRHWCQLHLLEGPWQTFQRGDAGNYSDSDVNLPVEDGYGALIEKLARQACRSGLA